MQKMHRLDGVCVRVRSQAGPGRVNDALTVQIWKRGPQTKKVLEIRTRGNTTRELGWPTLPPYVSAPARLYKGRPLTPQWSPGSAGCPGGVTERKPALETPYWAKVQGSQTIWKQPSALHNLNWERFPSYQGGATTVCTCVGMRVNECNMDTVHRISLKSR